ncbi:MAG: ATP-dependent zinc protease family protein [Candidatus Acidiferrum sp.]
MSEPFVPTSPGEPLTIGWKEYITFPEWGVPLVKAKIDTGARTSALDAKRCELIHRSTGLLARLELSLIRRHPETVLVVELPVIRLVVVASSNGDRQERPVIETTICLGPITKRLELTVTDRSPMLMPVLLGRSALAGTFIVDALSKYLLGKKRHTSSQ